MSTPIHQQALSLVNSEPGTGRTNQLEGLTVAMIVVFEFPPSESCTRSPELNFLIRMKKATSFGSVHLHGALASTVEKFDHECNDGLACGTRLLTFYLEKEGQLRVSVRNVALFAVRDIDQNHNDQPAQHPWESASSSAQNRTLPTPVTNSPHCGALKLTQG